jgi:hypothetical protein
MLLNLGSLAATVSTVVLSGLYLKQRAFALNVHHLCPLNGVNLACNNGGLLSLRFRLLNCSVSKYYMTLRADD